uniref:Uncharacterized protein TCIL3000_11_9620 n=1 Tax=Trypanosoma congolense (strain IL3000) TaxID=1068625 RepID=G0V1H4_TRYCI|nr:unnamed protein product [Trypanosoma congolense IL3000]
MLLQFNWDRLDVTAAEALRALINAKLEEELAQRRGAQQGVGASEGQGGTEGDIACGVESLCVASIEWGNVPPFVEVVELDDAVEFAASTPTSTDAALGFQDFGGALSSSTYGGGSATPFFLRPSPSSSITAMDGFSEPGSCAAAPHTGGAGARQEAGTRMGHLASPSHAPNTPPKDAFAPYVGPRGLYMCLHVTYGGPMRVSVSCVLRHAVSLGPVAIPVRMPLQLQFSKMDMDFHLCMNLHHNVCRVWMEPGKLSASPLNRINVVAIFGERRSSPHHLGELCLGAQSGGDDLDTSDAWTYVGSSHIGSDDADDTVLVEESVVSQFVLKEIRSILQEKIIYPHSVVVPLSL